jgi:hypothetical protein
MLHLNLWILMEVYTVKFMTRQRGFFVFQLAKEIPILGSIIDVGTVSHVSIWIFYLLWWCQNMIEVFYSRCRDCQFELLVDRNENMHCDAFTVTD